MCWIYGQNLKMKPADVVVMKTTTGTREEYTVSGLEEVADLREWLLDEENKKKAEKITLVNKVNGSKISLKCDTAQEADEWVAELRKIMDAIGVQEPRDTRQKATFTESRKPGPPPAEKESKKPDVRSQERERDEPETEKLHGKHKFTYANGDVYDGDWVHGKKHGYGTYSRSDGSIYEGEYHRDRKHGQGRCTWPNGNVYVGKWADGVQQGKGILTCSDGRRYEGDWHVGKQHGRGTFSNNNGDVYGKIQLAH
jgi:hypothetical protein